MADIEKRRIELINAASKKTKKELENIANKKDSDNEANVFEDFSKEMKDKKKEKEKFSKMNKKDFSKMSLKELIELKNRMNDLGVGKASGGKIYSKNQPRKVSYVD